MTRKPNSILIHCSLIALSLLGATGAVAATQVEKARVGTASARHGAALLPELPSIGLLVGGGALGAARRRRFSK